MIIFVELSILIAYDAIRFLRQNQSLFPRSNCDPVKMIDAVILTYKMFRDKCDYSVGGSVNESSRSTLVFK